MSTRHPSKVFRIGFVSASVFAKEIDVEGGKRTIHSVNVQKRYLDGDKAKFTNSLGLGELPQAIRCLLLAQEYVESQEAEVNIND